MSIGVGLTLAARRYPGYKLVKRSLESWRDGHGLEAIAAAHLIELALWLKGCNYIKVVPVGKDQMLVTDDVTD